MDLYQLECFQVVARMQHISNAAAKLHLTQPALSKIIFRVEEYVGYPLFDRVKGKIYLNESGQIFLSHLDTMFAELNNGLDQIRANARVADNSIYVASSADSILAQSSERFFATHPDVKIKYLVSTPEQIREGLLQKGLDFALTTMPPAGSGIDWIPVGEEEILLIAGDKSPLYGETEVSFAQLKDVDIMCECLGGDLRSHVDRCFAEAKIRPKIMLESTAGASMGFSIGNHRAVSFMPAHRFMQIYQIHHSGPVDEADGLFPRVIPRAIRLKDPVCTQQVGLASRTGSQFGKVTQEFYDYILSSFRKMYADAQEFVRQYFENN